MVTKEVAHAVAAVAPVADTRVSDTVLIGKSCPASIDYTRRF